MYGKAMLSLVFVLLIVLLLISYSIFMGTVNFISYLFPLLQSPATMHPLCATNPPLWVYMYNLPHQFNMMGSLLYEGDGAEDRDAIWVLDLEMADIFFVPFFSLLSFNTHGHVMTDLETEIDQQLQIDLLKFLRQSKYWQQSGGRDHVNASIQIVVDFGRYPRTMSNMSKDVVAPCVHIDSFAEDDSTDPFESCTTLLFFRGRTFQMLKATCSEGIVHVTLAKILVAYDDVHYERSVAMDENIKVSSQGMRLSKFCLQPDTPSSCRLFEAIVSHCVPVIASDQIELPFEDEIDYAQFSIFFSFKEALKPGYMVNELRNFPKEKWIEMWKQVKHKLLGVKLAIHRSQKLKVPN
ncbi:hypothetical protein CIPAW_05G111300 [Carya illinoinensis]|uniref:Exostosin GT47 domain-containing protein n=1 Tax=Carya illinoinensis TaxID=32201 RepID=A0A8T1QHA0_CARIL|nr:hypothetical protein CIPAW_05G111300 [Carya illinoinensis]KAG6712530.1 hypothetical protein I3842_05G108400 [Carya illinoinensis]